MRKTSLSFFLCLFGILAASQTGEITFSLIQKSNGVLYNVFDLTQDRNGFIWFRTAGNQGIQRYDGYDFVHFLDSAGFFSSITEDSRGLLWLGTSSGIRVFDPEKEKSMNFLIAPGNLQRNYSPNNITEIIEDHQGTLWCATSDGLVKIKPKTEADDSRIKDNIFKKGIASVFDISIVKIHKSDTSAGINQISEIYQDSQNRIWVGGFGSLYLFNPENDEYIRIDHGENGSSRLSDPYISSILEESRDVFWVGTGNGLCRISNIRNAFPYSGVNRALLDFDQYLDMKLITDLLRDDQNSMWVGTYLNGLVRMQYDDQGLPEFKEMYTELYEPVGEGIRTVFSLMKDHTGLVWAGHQYGGIRKFAPGGNYFTSYDKIIRNHLANYELNPITKDDEDNLWIGTYGDGLHKISRNGQVTSYAIQDDAFPGKYGNGVLSILKIEEEIFWIGAANGIWQFNTRTGNSRKLFSKTRYGELNDNIYDMKKIDRFVLFSLWGEGLFIYNLSTEELRHYTHNPNDSLGLRSNIVYSICPMRNGLVCIGGSRGINQVNFNRITGEITFLPLPFSNNALNKLGTVNILHEDREGNLWCGTDNGLFRTDLRSGQMRQWTGKDGLSFEVIHSMEEDDRGNLWLGTTNGLSLLIRETGKIKTFNKSSGLPVLIHAHHSSFRDREGFLYFGGIGGLYRFHPDSIKTNELVPPVRITDFRLFNKQVKVNPARQAILSTNIAYTREIVLSYNQNDISFTFSALDFNNPGQNRYAYMMEGYQEDWIETGADNRIATYTNLNPGKYVFRIKGSNNNGVWNEEGAFISVIINPPFWKTTIAYVVYGVMFLLLLRGYIYWRTRRLRKEKILLEKQVNERTEELQATLENLQKTQEQLIESEKMAALGSLVAGVAHEINTPVGIGITAISTLMDDIRRMAGLFQQNAINRGDFQEFLQMSFDAGALIQKNLERTASLIQSFKQVSVDQVSEQKREFGLKEYLYDILSGLQPGFKKKKIDVRIFCDDELTLNSYPGVYAQIFTNLLLNSIQHGFNDRESGTIVIKAETNKEWLKIRYTDDGSGISEKDLPHIFEPFYTSDQRRGTGLGLNIIYNLIRQKLYGNISCQSAPGKGVVFNIEVPVT